MTVTTTHPDTHALEALRNAARESFALLLHSGANRNGRVPADPLRRLIEGDGQASALARDLTEQITGKRITRAEFQNTAPACRAALRRWAERIAREQIEMWGGDLAYPTLEIATSAALAALAEQESAR